MSNLLRRIWNALTDQRGEINFVDLFGGAGDYVSQAAGNIPDITAGGGGGFSGLSFSPGPALSSGPVGDVGGGFPGFAQNLLGDIGGLAKQVLPVAQLGGGLMGIASGIRGATQLGEQTKLAEQAAKRQGDISKAAEATAGPLSAFSQSELAAGQAGRIPPAIQAQIDLWAQGAKQRVQQVAASSGQGNSSQLASWMSWIDAQAQAMQATALEQEMQRGIQAGGVAGSVLGGAASAAGGSGQTAAGQQVGMENLIAAANAALARLG
jgi:hypothetical protein